MSGGTRLVSDNTIAPGENNEDVAMTVVVKGGFRFVVKEVKQTFPFLVAIVDELLDEAPNSSDSPSAVRSGYKEDDDDDNDDMYADLPTSELVPRALAAMKAITDQGISTKPKEKSPHEESILEQSNMPRGMIQSMSSMAQKCYIQ